MGTPSAPPIRENSEGEIKVSEDKEEEVMDPIVDQRETIETMNQASETVCSENINDRYPSMNSYHSSSQNAWQIFVAYDACFRLCLNAWARGCMEAPRFLQDECLLLRNAFGYVDFFIRDVIKVSRR